MRFEALLRSGIAAVTIAGVGAAFLILGVAAVSWRTQCAAEPGAGICFGAPAAEAVPEGAVAGPEFKASADVVAEVTSAQSDPRLEPEPQPAEAVAESTLAPAIVPEATTAEPAPTMVAAASQPAPAPVADPATGPSGGEVAEMMASTFEALTQMKAAVNAAAATGEPVALPTEHELATSAPAAEVAAAQEPAFPGAAEPAPADVAVAAVEPQAEIALPKPQALAIAQTGTAPTKRTVKVIPVGPEGVTESAAATAAAIAVAPATPAEEPPEVLAFADPSATPTPRRPLEVNDNLVNVRSGPSTDAEKLWVLKRGNEVQALAVSGDWVQVEVSEGKVGWMLREFLTEADLAGLPEEEPSAPAETDVAAVAEPEPAPEPEVETEQLVAEAVTETATELTGDVRTVLGAGVNVRSSPSSGAEKLFALPGGRKVSVSETQRGWLKITDDKGRSGWLYESYVSGG